MQSLSIQLTKRNDGGSVLMCRRADGTSTWQRQKVGHASFFALHDLTHFAVETELAMQNGFFGLIAAGWNTDETTGKSARGPLPREAVFVEFVVGLFDLERASGREWSAAEVAEHATGYFAEKDTLTPSRTLTDEQLSRIRARLKDLIRRWAAIAPGQMMQLTFERSTVFV